MSFQIISSQTSSKRARLNSHSIYKSLNELDDIKIFMQFHIFAVWDFMSLLKKLQQLLTCTQTPWIAPVNRIAARLINEIVLEEESDLGPDGQYISHFDLYLEAMKPLNASSMIFNNFIQQLQSGMNVFDAIDKIPHQSIRNFLNFTFKLIETGETHRIAAAFTFGREDIIPDMFMKIIKETNENSVESAPLRYYLQRHIELDGGHHGPLSEKLIDSLCKNDSSKIKEAVDTANEAIQLRIELWSFIEEQLKIQQSEKSVAAID